MNAKKPTVIILSGLESCGKTMTVRRVYAMLKNEFNCHIREENYSIGGNDFWALISINGVKIGITSQGDPRSGWNRILDTFVKNKCALILCAAQRTQSGANTKHNIERKITDKFNGCPITVFRKREAKENLRDDSNEKMARLVFTFFMHSWACVLQAPQK